MRKREYILFLLILVMIVIPINGSIGWVAKYQLNKGTDIPFEISSHTGGLADWAILINKSAELNYYEILRNLELEPEPNYDFVNYFYIIIEIDSRNGDSPRILSLDFDGDRYITHIIRKEWHFDDLRDPSSSIIYVLKISRSHYELAFSVDAELYSSDYGFDFIFYVVLDLLIISRIIYLKSKKRPILATFFESKYISLDRLTNDTLADLERREELRNAMDEEN